MPKRKIIKPEEIKKCPFCGRKPKVREVQDYDGTREAGKRDVPYWFVSCYEGRQHSIQVGGRHEKTAIRMWNKRVSKS